MKQLTSLLLAAWLTFGLFFGASAQAAESIWIEASQTSVNAGDNVTVTVNARSATPIQGFSFQLSYDPACLKPETPASLLTGINLLSVPQTAGLVDGIFAGSVTASANGPLAKVNFKALAACQTSLTLKDASLIVRDATGMAAVVPGVSLSTGSLSLNVGGQPAAAPQATSAAAQPGSSPQPQVTLAPAATPGSGQPNSLEQASRLFRWLILPLLILLGVAVIAGLVIIVMLVFARNRQSASAAAARVHKTAMLYIQRGPGAGSSLPLVAMPTRIGSDPENEIHLEDARLAPLHARILADNQGGYALLDMGSQEGTYLNGQRLAANQPVPLKNGDALRLGGVLLVFNPLH